MKTVIAFLCLSLLGAGLTLLRVGSSEAVPAFARREGARCQMCHFRVPELNEDGHSYIRRGFREEPPGAATMPGMDMGSPPGAKAPVASTDRPLGEPLPIEWQRYLTVMGHHSFEARSHQQAGFHSGTLDGWIGGPLDPHWSGVADLAFDIQAGGVEVEQAYAQYNTSWSPRFESLRVGQLLPLAIVFNGGAAAMSLTAPVVLEVPTRARSPWAPTALLRGVEVGLVDLPRWNAYLGAGQPQLDPLAGGSHTDVYASVEYLVGEKGDALSGFGYHGRIAASPGRPSLDYERVALFANGYGPRVKGVLGILWGSDTPAGERSLGTAGGFLLGEFLLTERWAGYARYDHASRDVAVGDPETTDGATVGVSFWAQTQVRLTLESQFLNSSDASGDRSATAELMWAF